MKNSLVSESTLYFHPFKFHFLFTHFHNIELIFGDDSRLLLSTMALFLPVFIIFRNFKMVGSNLFLNIPHYNSSGFAEKKR